MAARVCTREKNLSVKNPQRRDNALPSSSTQVSSSTSVASERQSGLGFKTALDMYLHEAGYMIFSPLLNSFSGQLAGTGTRKNGDGGERQGGVFA